MSGKDSVMKSLILFGFLAAMLCNLYAQPYKYYTNRDGLSKNTVTSILKDSRGFMWFGTPVGLNRFDGYKFKTYFHNENDSTSICNNNIRKILEDEKGDFWLATTNGLSKYNYETNRFINYFHDPNKNGTLSNNYINSIILDRNRNLWIATSEGFDKYLPATNTFKHFVFRANDRGILENKSVYDIIQDSKGLFWLCAEGSGLVSFSEETEQFSIFKGDEGLSPIGNSINGKIFVQNETNILKINAENGFFDFNTQTKRFSLSKPSQKNENLDQIDYNPLIDLYDDKAGSFWIKSPSRGIIFYDSTKNKFKSFSDANSNYGLIDKSVAAFAEDKNGNIWIGTSKGLCTFNPISKSFANRTTSSKTVYAIHKSIFALCFDKNQNLWIGSSSGLYHYNTKTDKLKAYYHDFQNSNSLINDKVDCIFEDSKGNIWVGGSGLNLYIKSSDNFKQFKAIKNSNKTVNSQYVVHIYENKSGELWITTWAGGINIYHPDTKEFSFITNDLSQKSIIKSNDIGSVVEDSKGFLWCTSNYGITKYNTFTKKAEWYSENDGLVNNVVSDVLEDDNGMIWISTGKGVSMFNPESSLFKNYDVDDGLQGNEFTYNTALKGHDGKLYFGGTEGFSIIDPGVLRENKTKPKVCITDIQIFNKSVGIGEKLNGRVILPQNIVDTKSITLSHHESVISLEFAALHFTNPEKNQYAYMLEGLDDKWNYTTAQRRYVTYTTLNPGKYTFKVKASNSDGVWNETPTSLELIILPPWWKTIWFKVFLIVFLIGLIQLAFYIQLNSIRNSKKKFEKLVRLRTNDLEEANSQLGSQKENLENLNTALETHQQEIEFQKEEISQQNNDLKTKNNEILEISQRIHDLDQMKLRYFTNISHEFRTPITLITSPLDSLIESGAFDKKNHDQLSIIKNSANRLLRLVNQLLDIGKLDSGTMLVKKTKGDFVKFVESILASYKGQAKQRNIDLGFETGLSELNILFDFDKMEKVFFNLLSNSFKFVPDGASVLLRLSVEGNEVVVQVSDTGIGIPKDQLNKIFEPFYQVDSSNTRFHEGSGIGLYHTQELVLLLDGTINISSAEGKGTTVEVKFPYEVSTDNFETAVVGKQTDKTKRTTYRATEAANIDQIMEKRNPLLLLVEDNAELRAYINAEFCHSYTVIEAENGKQGLGMIREYQPDLIISDIMMPEMDGLELCRQIKEDEQISHIPIILLTAKADEADVIGGIELGADEYITKPFNIKHLYAKADQLLLTRSKLKEKFSKEVFFEASKMAFSQADKRFLEKLIQLVEKNIASENFQVADIAQEIGMGKTNLYKKVQAITNQSVADFVRTIRLKTAAKLLLTNELSVSEVSFQVGFKDASHFIKSFTRQYNITPKRFIEQQRQNRSL